MTKLALLSSGLIAAAIIATPVMARDHHAARQAATDQPVATDTYPGYYAGNAYAAYPGPGYYGGYSCSPAPRVGAFATAPWTDMPPCQPYYSGY
jgi:hypothetical protein